MTPTITWLGHATMHIMTPAGTSVLIDPWLEGNPAYPKTAPKLEKLDILLCTHGHSDHIGSAVQVAKKFSPQVVCMPELGAYLASEGVDNVSGMNIGGQQRIADVNIVMTDARHSSGVESDGTIIPGGNPAGYVLEIDGAPTLYHAGDTCVFGDMRILAELYAPKIAMLPIGDHYTMGPRQAALAAEYLGNPVILPMHFGTFPVLTGTPELLRDEIARRGGKAEVHTWRPGESYSL